MKKDLAIYSIFLLLAIFFAANVLAAGEHTDVKVNIQKKSNFVLSTSSIDFGPVITGSVNNDGIDFTINADESNDYVILTLNQINGELFQNGLKLNGTKAVVGQTYEFTCSKPNPENPVCVYESINVNPTLDVPYGLYSDPYIKTGSLVFNDGTNDYTINLAAEVKGFIQVQISPETIDFGDLYPDTSDNQATSDITFDATGSSGDITVKVIYVSNEPFHSGLKLGGNLALNQVFNIPCDFQVDHCVYIPVIADPTLDIPAGFSSGLYNNGVIGYEILGQPPAQ